MDARRKKLLYRATHRGFKEADIIIGGYVHHHGDRMDEALLADFEKLLAAPDQDLYQWIMNKATPPETFNGLALKALQQFAQSTEIAGLVRAQTMG